MCVPQYMQSHLLTFKFCFFSSSSNQRFSSGASPMVELLYKCIYWRMGLDSRRCTRLCMCKDWLGVQSSRLILHV
jgi:hypothetical protein